MTPASAQAEARSFLERHPDTESFDLLISDLNGVMRGKRIPRDNLIKAYRNGINLPASLFALDINGNTIEETGLGLSSGDSDRVCWPVPGSLHPTPWLREGRQAQLLMTMEELDGSPFFADPRQVLRRVLDGFRTRGLTPVVALELEFYLVDRRRDELGLAQPPRGPGGGGPPPPAPPRANSTRSTSSTNTPTSWRRSSRPPPSRICPWTPRSRSAPPASSRSI